MALSCDRALTIAWVNKIVLGNAVQARSAILVLVAGLVLTTVSGVSAQPKGAVAPIVVAAVAPQADSESVRTSTPEKPVQMGPSGLPVPRWVSLKSGRVNVRQGPSSDHAILWTYVREGLPVEIIAEFDTWRRIRDQSGETGWVRQQMISGRRTVVVTGDGNVPMTTEPATAGKIVAFATPGLVAELQACKGEWCAVEARGYDGYVPRSRLWGVYKGE